WDRRAGCYAGAPSPSTGKWIGRPGGPAKHIECRQGPAFTASCRTTNRMKSRESAMPARPGRGAAHEVPAGHPAAVHLRHHGQLLAEPLSAGVLFDPLDPAQTDQLHHEIAAPAAVPVVTQSKAERFGGPRGERSAI